MLSISNLLCDDRTGNESLRYGHTAHKGFDGAPRPVVVWAVTKACNLRCAHCYASAGPRPDAGELSKIIDSSLVATFQICSQDFDCLALNSE